MTAWLRVDESLGTAQRSGTNNMGTPSDLELYEQARGGSSPALATLIARHGQAVLDGLCGQGNEGILDDAMQEAWMAALSSTSPFAGSSFRRWFGTIARRGLARLQRQAARDQLELARQSTRRASTRILIDQLVDAIDRLPNYEQREAAKLYWIRGLTSAEISELTSSSKKTVESRLRLARTQLKRMLAEDSR